MPHVKSVRVIKHAESEERVVEIVFAGGREYHLSEESFLEVATAYIGARLEAGADHNHVLNEFLSGRRMLPSGKR